jgi:hypothetical protein
MVMRGVLSWTPRNGTCGNSGSGLENQRLATPIFNKSLDRAGTTARSNAIGRPCTAPHRCGLTISGQQLSISGQQFLFPEEFQHNGTKFLPHLSRWRGIDEKLPPEPVKYPGNVPPELALAQLVLVALFQYPGDTCIGAAISGLRYRLQEWAEGPDPAEGFATAPATTNDGLRLRAIEEFLECRRIIYDNKRWIGLRHVAAPQLQG